MERDNNIIINLYIANIKIYVHISKYTSVQDNVCSLYTCSFIFNDHRTSKV